MSRMYKWSNRISNHFQHKKYNVLISVSLNAVSTVIQCLRQIGHFCMQHWIDPILIEHSCTCYNISDDLFVCVYHSVCSDTTNKFLYRPGKTYEYEFESNITTTIASTSSERSSLRMRAVAKLETVSTCEMVLWVSRLYQFYPLNLAVSYSIRCMKYCDIGSSSFSVLLFAYM